MNGIAVWFLECLLCPLAIFQESSPPVTVTLCGKAETVQVGFERQAPRFQVMCAIYRDAPLVKWPGHMTNWRHSDRTINHHTCFSSQLFSAEIGNL